MAKRPLSTLQTICLTAFLGVSISCVGHRVDARESRSQAATLRAVESAGALPKVEAQVPQTVVDVDDPWLRPGGVALWRGDLDGMIARGFIRLLAPASRTHYFVDGARERGIAVETANALERELEQLLGERGPVRVLVVPARRDQLLPMLAQGLGDIAVGNLTITPERKRLVDFGPAVVSDVRELVVTAQGVAPVMKVEDLAGREIWVRASSSYNASLVALSDRFLSMGLDPIDLRTADERMEDEGILEMVNAGLYPATVIDSHKLEWIWADVFDKVAVSEVAVREKGQIAAAIRKNSPELAALLADFYQTRGLGTKFGDAIVDRYYRRSRWLQNVTSTDDRRRFDAVVDYFREYSDQFGFDYLMMVAQGFEESRLDPNARSPRGAIGIMQLMPETATGFPLYMHDVKPPALNILAGVKYMRYLVDQFFDDPTLDDVNRHLFALAAYNAGPNRVARLRRQAPEYGLNPNLWFKNVEHLVASGVGQEPVRYVGRIYRYYLGYRRLREIERSGESSPSIPASRPN